MSERRPQIGEWEYLMEDLEVKPVVVRRPVEDVCSVCAMKIDMRMLAWISDCVGKAGMSSKRLCGT